MTDAGSEEIPEPVGARGITDRASGIERARASRQWLYDAAEYALGRGSGSDLYDGHLLVMGMSSRALGMHDGAVNALESDNPFATYTLLRSYAENAASLIYAIEKPNQLHRILGLGSSRPIKIGTITNYAEQGSKRFGSFRDVYGDLSEFAHPMSRSIFAALAPTEDGFHWQLDPKFKYDNDFVVACSLVVEMAEANSHLLREYADAQGWPARPS
jgi:hypothetical protein